MFQPGNQYARLGTATRNAKLTPEQRRAIARNAGQASAANRTPEQRAAIGKLGALTTNAKLTPEQRSANGKLGGHARAAKLTPAQRRAIAHQGLQGLANHHFHGDINAAREWLICKGLHIQDPGANTSWELFPDPGPLPY